MTHIGTRVDDTGNATREPIRAAQYVRMSTEHQKYSTENQSEIIVRYAAQRGITIVRTYADHGKSASASTDEMPSSVSSETCERARSISPPFWSTT